MASVRSPRCAFVAARSGGEPAEIRAVGVHRPDVVIALTRGEGDRVTLRRPARLRVESILAQATDVGALGVHHVDLRGPRAIGDERDLTSCRRPRGLRVDTGEGGQTAEGP